MSGSEFGCPGEFENEGVRLARLVKEGCRWPILGCKDCGCTGGDNVRRPRPLVVDDGYGSPAPMDEVVESDPGDDLRSLPIRSPIIPRLEGSRSDEGVNGARTELVGVLVNGLLDMRRPARPGTLLETTDGHSDLSFGNEWPNVRIAAASSV
jgi:hypothetical protein